MTTAAKAKQFCKIQIIRLCGQSQKKPSCCRPLLLPETRTGVQNLLSKSQATPHRSVEQGQVKISPNHPTTCKAFFCRSRYSVLVRDDNSTITITAATTITADTAVDSASVSFASFSSARGRESLTYDAALRCLAGKFSHRSCGDDETLSVTCQ